MYLIEIELVPTAALTFRILPGSVLDIGTYPFVPPTALSGFLRRVAMLSDDSTDFLSEQDAANPFYYVMPRSLIVLGAYSDWLMALHKTHRKGPRDFNHNAFSRLYTKKPPKKPTHDENIQLHTWEYWLAESLRGYVVSEDEYTLRRLKAIEGPHASGGFGCKFGKEGYAFVKSVSEPQLLRREKVEAHPATIICADDLLNSNPHLAADIYNLYRFDWPDAELLSLTSPFDNQPSSVNGYVPFIAALLGKHQSAQLEYYISPSDTHIPASLVDLLK